MKQLLASLYHDWQKWHKANAIYKLHLNLYKKIYAQCPELNIENPKEKEWLKIWKKYDKRVSVHSFRIFSKFIGDDMNIMPLEICANHVEDILTPQEYIGYYSDKNTLNQFIPNKYLPKVFLRNINGIYCGEDYKPIAPEQAITSLNKITDDKLIIKPTKECSGRGVKLLRKEKGHYIDENKQIVDLQYLQNRYKRDFIIQQCVHQCVSLAQFNPTSVNTIRIFTYRNHLGTIYPMHAVLRIGAKGASVDNAHSGGMFCGIDENGKLGKYCCSWLGERKTVFNDCDFANNEYIIPKYEEVKKFSIDIAERIPFQDLVAMDIAIDEHLNPKLIEINVGGFGAWLFQFVVGAVFDPYTEEVMQRCQ